MPRLLREPGALRGDLRPCTLPPWQIQSSKEYGELFTSFLKVPLLLLPLQQELGWGHTLTHTDSIFCPQMTDRPSMD